MTGFKEVAKRINLSYYTKVDIDRGYYICPFCDAIITEEEFPEDEVYRNSEGNYICPLCKYEYEIDDINSLEGYEEEN